MMRIVVGAAILFALAPAAAQSSQVEVTVVLDKAFLDAHGAESEAIACAAMWRANQYFTSSDVVDIELFHIATQTFAAGDPYSVTVTDGKVSPSDLLTTFQTWAAANLTTDVAFLMTGYEVSDAILGFSFTGAACTANGAGFVTYAHGFESLAYTLAHELGHTLGMCHDPPANRPSPVCASLPGGLSCEDKLMAAVNPADGPWPQEFSDCSAVDFETWLGAPQMTCTTTPVAPTSIALGTGLYLDRDGDGFGDPQAAIQSCGPFAGAVADSTDCDDHDREAYPGAIEIADDEVDQDCNGSDLVTPAPDAGAGGDPGGGDSGGCGCRASAPSTGGLLVWGVLAAVHLRRRRRR